MFAAFARHLQRLWWTPRLTPLTVLLTPLAWVVGTVAARRRAAGPLNAEPLPVPVIVIGNVIVGGAGKTPTVIALVTLLREWGWQPGIVSRGHGRDPDASAGQGDARGEGQDDARAMPPVRVLDDGTPAARATPRMFGDEPLLMHRRTGAPVAVGRLRRDAAQHLLRLHPEIDILIADDGLQHHALARDIEIVVFDDRGIGNGWTLPAGPLRERPDGLWPARNRFALVNGRWPAPPAIAHPAPADVTWEARRAIGGIVELADWQRGLAAGASTPAGLIGRPLLACAGIGDPERFFSMLEARGLRIARLPQPDHANFEPLPWDASTPDVVVTEKDAVKLAGRGLGGTRVWVATLDFSLPDGLVDVIRDALPTRPDRIAENRP